MKRYPFIFGHLMQTHNQTPFILTFEYFAYVMYILARSIKTIHSLGYAHCDIKPNNIAMTDSNIPVLIDFGVAYHRSIKSDNPRGTFGFISPEFRTKWD